MQSVHYLYNGRFMAVHMLTACTCHVLFRALDCCIICQSWVHLQGSYYELTPTVSLMACYRFEATCHDARRHPHMAKTMSGMKMYAITAPAYIK